MGDGAVRPSWEEGRAYLQWEDGLKCSSAICGVMWQVWKQAKSKINGLFCFCFRKEVTKKEKNKEKILMHFFQYWKKDELCRARFDLRLLSFYFLTITGLHTFRMGSYVDGKQHVQTAMWQPGGISSSCQMSWCSSQVAELLRMQVAPPAPDVLSPSVIQTGLHF